VAFVDFVLKVEVDGGEVCGAFVDALLEAGAVFFECSFGAEAVGDIEDGDEAGGDTVELKGVADDFDAEVFAIFPLMGDRSGALDFLGKFREGFHEVGDAIGGTELGEPEGEEFLAGVAVGGEGLIIGVENAKGLGIVDPHGEGVVLEEELVVACDIGECAAGVELRGGERAGVGADEEEEKDGGDADEAEALDHFEAGEEAERVAGGAYEVGDGFVGERDPEQADDQINGGDAKCGSFHSAAFLSVRRGHRV
jgi:hypothetical protein